MQRPPEWSRRAQTVAAVLALSLAIPTLAHAILVGEEESAYETLGHALALTHLRYSSAAERYVILFRAQRGDPWVMTCFPAAGRVFLSVEVAALPVGREWPHDLPLWLLETNFQLAQAQFAIDPEEAVVYLRTSLPESPEPDTLRQGILALATAAEQLGPQVAMRIEHEAPPRKGNPS